MGTILRATRRTKLLVLAGVMVAAALVAYPSLAKEGTAVIPPPIADLPAKGRTSEVAVFAGGCFWGVQGVFQHVKGVTSAVSGYTGGQQSTARYEVVSRGGTGHAESVQVTFDPRQVSYGRLLQVFFSVVHDPTQFNRQGPDVGAQYRSVIFPTSAEQETIARAYVAQLNRARVFRGAIMTKIESGRPFFRAEEYHQDYLKKNPRDIYVVINDLPKLDDLKKTFPGLYRMEPVLVSAR